MTDNSNYLHTLQVPLPDYLRYSPERSPDEGHYNLGYRSSSSSSSAGSGKQLVGQRPLYGRFDRRNHHRDVSYGASSSSGSSPEVHMNPKKFYIGSPPSPGSSRGSSTPRQCSPEPPSSPTNEKKQNSLYPRFLYDHNSKMSPNVGKISYIYGNYSPLVRAKFCNPKECYFGTKCSQCALKEETLSKCSSEDPPPTFTAVDTYNTVRKKAKYCPCGTLFITTTIISLLVLFLIAAFIIYIEMVIKQNQYIPEPM